MDHGACPKSAEHLQHQGYLDSSKSPHDRWGRAFRVECDGYEISVTSPGPDGKHGTADDVVAE